MIPLNELSKIKTSCCPVQVLLLFFQSETNKTFYNGILKCIC